MSSNLPNSTNESVRIFPNEYVTNQVVNRVHNRLLDNDLYLESLIDGNTSGEITAGTGLSGGGHLADNPVISLGINAMTEKASNLIVGNEELAIYDPDTNTHMKATLNNIAAGAASTIVSASLYDGLMEPLYANHVYQIGLDFNNLLAPSCGGSWLVPSSALMAIYNPLESEHYHRKVHIYDLANPLSASLTGSFLLRGPNDFNSFGTEALAYGDRLLFENNSSSFSKKYTTIQDITGAVVGVGTDEKVKAYSGGTAGYLVDRLSYAGGYITGYINGDTLELSANGVGGGAGVYIPLAGSNAIAGDLILTVNKSNDLGDATHLWDALYINDIGLENDILPKYNDVSNLGSASYVFNHIYGNDFTVTGDVVPMTDNVSNIGDATHRFNSLYANEIYTSGGTIHLEEIGLGNDKTIYTAYNSKYTSLYDRGIHIGGPGVQSGLIITDNDLPTHMTETAIYDIRANVAGETSLDVFEVSGTLSGAYNTISNMTINNLDGITNTYVYFPKTGFYTISLNLSYGNSVGASTYAAYLYLDGANLNVETGVGYSGNGVAVQTLGFNMGATHLRYVTAGNSYLKIYHHDAATDNVVCHISMIIKFISTDRGY